MSNLQTVQEVDAAFGRGDVAARCKNESVGHTTPPCLQSRTIIEWCQARRVRGRA